MLEVRKIRLILELRESGISNSNVLSALELVPREKFIPINYRNQAYENIALPIGDNQTISQPYVVAKMTDLLDIKTNHKVLEIGTGSGYQCAILSKLARRVYTIERIKNLHEKSSKIFQSFKHSLEKSLSFVINFIVIYKFISIKVNCFKNFCVIFCISFPYK